MSEASGAPSKVVIVDDSQVMRRWLASVVGRDPRLCVVGSAANAQEARDVIKVTQPDVLTLDIEMPGMDGLEFLAHIMRLKPMPVVMLSSSFDKNPTFSAKATALGAVFCVKKPVFPTPVTIQLLNDTIVQASRPEIGVRSSTTDAPISASKDNIILVGASTGGVAAIEILLERLPANAPPVVIAQHMPHAFLYNFVERLNLLSSKSVDLAIKGDIIGHGDVRIAPAQNLQTRVARVAGGKWRIDLVDCQKNHIFCPSADVLFESAIPWAHRVCAVLLTGLGSDGALGMRQLAVAGAQTMVQSRESCVVYGMPGAAQAIGAAQHEVDIHDMAPEMMRLMSFSEGRVPSKYIK